MGLPSTISGQGRQPTIAITVAGRLRKVEMSVVAASSLSSDADIKEALAHYYDMDVRALGDCAVYRHANGDVTLKSAASSFIKAAGIAR